jgi:hypothetical protein
MGPGRGSTPLVKVWDVDWYGMHGMAAGCRCGGGAAARCGCTSCRCGAGPRGILAPLPFMESAAVLAYLPQYGGGVNVGVGPVDAQNGGFSAILTAPIQAASALVKSFVVTGGPHQQHAAGGLGQVEIKEMASFTAFDPVQRSGASVSAVSTLTGADVVVTPATDAPPSARRFHFDALQRQFVLVDQFRAFSTGSRGAAIGGK